MLDRVAERRRVLEVHIGGARPQEAERLRPPPEGGQLAGSVAQVSPESEPAATGTMTTRRRGSSPSDVVATPSSSLTTS